MLTTKNTYYIHDVAKMTNMHPNTIRNFIRRGRIPEPKREWNGFRVFTEEDVARIRKLTAAAA
ncbi:MAG: MerR family transcriptional regulator [Candidatus Omnitrophota bacterium]